MEKIYDAVYTAKAHLDRAKLSENGVHTMRTRLGNVLLNNVDGILKGLKVAIDAEKKIQSLERDVESLQVALDEADKVATATKAKGKHGDNPD